jgi:hypothetical protein
MGRIQVIGLSALSRRAKLLNRIWFAVLAAAWVPANADYVIATFFNKPELSAQRRVAAIQKEHVASRELGRGRKDFYSS